MQAVRDNLDTHGDKTLFGSDVLAMSHDPLRQKKGRKAACSEAETSARRNSCATRAFGVPAVCFRLMLIGACAGVSMEARLTNFAAQHFQDGRVVSVGRRRG